MSDTINVVGGGGGGGIARPSPSSSSSSPSSLFGMLAIAVAAVALLAAAYLYLKMVAQRKQLENIERQLKQQISEGDVVQMVMGTMQQYDHLQRQRHSAAAAATPAVFVKPPPRFDDDTSSDNEPLAQPACAGGVCPLPSAAPVEAPAAAVAPQPSGPSSIEEINDDATATATVPAAAAAAASDAETTDAVMRGLATAA